MEVFASIIHGIMKTMMDDQTLVQEFLKGRAPESLTTLVSRYERPIYAFHLRLLRDPHQAEEAAQETFLRMLRGLPGYRADRAFRPWLYGIALNSARTLAARKAQQRERERIASQRRREGDGTMNPADGAFQKELHALVDELPPAQKEALLLHYYQGLSHSEVASTLEVPAGTVATRIHGGLETLRSRLAPLGMTLSTVALAEYLGGSVAEAAPPSILAAVLGEASRMGTGTTATLQGGLLMAKTKLGTIVSIILLSITGGVGVGYAIRASHDRQEEPEKIVLGRSPSAAAPPVGAGVPLRSEKVTPPVLSAPGGAGTLVPSAPAPAAPDPRSKIRKFAGFIARVMKAAAANPNKHVQLSPQDTAEFVTLLTDRDLAEFMEKMNKSGGTPWGRSGDFMLDLLEELGVPLTEDQKGKLSDVLGQATNPGKPEDEQTSSAVEQKLKELSEGRDFFDRLKSMLTPEQGKTLEPYLTLFRPSVPAIVVKATGADDLVSAVLDAWTQNLVPLSEQDRLRVSSTAADYAGRLCSLQSELEARYGTGFTAALPSLPNAGFSASSGIKPLAPSAEAFQELDTPGLDGKLYDAFGRLLLLENNVRQSLVSLLPEKADAIRKADPYVYVFGSKK